MTKPLRVAVIGVGMLGRHHARILSTLPNVQLVAVVDPVAERAQPIAAEYHCDWVQDYRALANDSAEQIDAACVVVPTSLHCEVGSYLLKRGIPLLIEKPLAPTAMAGAVLVELARRNKVLLQVGHVERFNPAFEMLAERVRQPKYIRTERLSPYPFRSTDIGVIHDLMIHDLELVQSLTGSAVVRVEAFGLSLLGGHEDCVTARLTFADGCRADLTANRVCPQTVRTIQVWSAAGCIQCDLHARTLTSYRPGAALQAGELPFELSQQPDADLPALKAAIFEKYLPIEHYQAPTEDALTNELTDFINAVRSGSLPRVSGEVGLAALETADTVLASVAAHRWDGFQTDSRVGPFALLSTSAIRARAA